MPLCVHAEGQTLAAVMMLAQLCQRPIHVCHIATKTEVRSLILFNCTVCIVDDFLSSAVTVNYFGFTIGVLMSYFLLVAFNAMMLLVGCQEECSGCRNCCLSSPYNSQVLCHFYTEFKCCISH